MGTDEVDFLFTKTHTWFDRQPMEARDLPRVQLGAEHTLYKLIYN
jgi:hypothetical protein